ncbi:hypothetical protein [Chitinophaga sp. S165]|uniref:hypothetical protein n=1 Tax=Chitinophaga sp. S165 TaxID=2135462 RepID=UPI0011B3DFFD|nr:hypothetical protein [Chitinophaga sp. S165]
MTRIILFIAILMSAMVVKAQSPLSYGGMNGTRSALTDPHQMTDTNNLQKKLFITKYAAISTGFVAFKGGGGSFLSVPMGLQVNRQLTNNVIAFGGVSVEPSLFNFNTPLYQRGIGKNNGMMYGNNGGTDGRNFSINPAARIGVMYISNSGAFSISGSIGVSRSAYNGYSPFYAPTTFSTLRNYQQ